MRGTGEECGAVGGPGCARKRSPSPRLPPSPKPAALIGFSRSPRTKKWASAIVVSGMIPMRIPARLLSIRCWPKLISQNGTQLPASEIATLNSQNRRVNGKR